MSDTSNEKSERLDSAKLNDLRNHMLDNIVPQILQTMKLYNIFFIEIRDEIDIKWHIENNNNTIKNTETWDINSIETKLIIHREFYPSYYYDYNSQRNFIGKCKAWIEAFERLRLFVNPDLDFLTNAAKNFTITPLKKIVITEKCY